MATTFYWTDVDTEQTVLLVFDVVTGLTPDDPVQITDHPVEEGSDVTDNARDLPNRLSVEAIVSMTPNAKIDDDVEVSDVTLAPDMRKPFKTTTFPLDIPSPPIQLSESGLLQAGVGALVGLLSG